MPIAPLALAVDEAHFQSLVTQDVARRLRANDLSMTLSNGVAVLVTVAAFGDVVPRGWLWLWLGLQAVNLVFHLNLGLRWRRRELSPANAPVWLRLVTRTSVINGGLWALILLVAWPHCSEHQRMMAAVGMMGVASIALHSLHGHLPAYHAMAGLCTASLVAALLWSGGLANGGLVLMLVVYLLVSARFATLLHGMLIDTFRKGRQMVELTARLQQEKDRAVNLSQSRSRFLAAASHDLRQPVHALSLFVGALHRNPTAAQSGVILQHVGTAVDTMGAMFDALLDISKLDADLLQPEWRVVDLQPMLARIGAEHALMASAKGLQLNLNLQTGQPLWVRTDPVLLERVLRNLLSNALRYTAQGTVCLWARARAGRVELAVADTGVGMARHRQAEAFEEFVQLHQGHGPEQGLGLGLAIVRRLVGLLGMRMALRSRPGRGTVFTLHLPQADQPMAAGSGALAAMPLASDALGLRPGDVVIVIDDNVAIQLAMRALLSGWGCVAHVAANQADLMPQLMDLQAVPALLLCDGEGGIDAIAEIREAFNLEVPAILISGDTGPERLREAVASGLPLLHKPVTQARLREAIVQVMGPRSGPQPGRLPPLAGGAPRSGS